MISSERIPNNVDLSGNKRLQRALEHWQPAYLDWWRDMGPEGFQDHHQVYLRTAISVDAAGWAHFDWVKLPEYRWGIFLAEPTHDRRIGFGDFKGQPVWQEVPGEFRNQLRRLIVIQGDTEPASVEQQRSARSPLPEPLRPSQPVPGERGGGPSPLGDGLPAALLLRPGWSRGGRGAARAPQRQLRHAAHARGVQRADRHVARLLCVHDVHRPRRQVATALALGELARPAGCVPRGSCSPKKRTTCSSASQGSPASWSGPASSCRESGFSGDVRRAGGIDLPLIQKFVNFWFSQSLDLHGSEVSSNAAAYFSNGLKGRAEEDKFDDDHILAANLYVLDNAGRQRPHHPAGSADAQRAQRGIARLVRG